MDPTSTSSSRSRRIAGTRVRFEQSDVDAVARQIAGVETAAGSVSANTTAFHNGQDWATSVQGTSTAFLNAQSIDVEQGRSFSSAEESAGKNVCLLGIKVRDAIFLPGDNPLGADVRLKDVSCTVIGVLEKRGQAGGGGQDSDNVVMMPLKTVQRRFTGSDDLHYFVVKYDAAYSSRAFRRPLIDLLRERRLLQPGQDNDFNIIDTAQINQAVSSPPASSPRPSRRLRPSACWSAGSAS